MDIAQSEIDGLVRSPSESLAVEIKRWLDPASPEGKVQLVRAALALRNHGGGYILIGFDDKTLAPDPTGMPTDIRKAFHADTIQEIVAKYASEPFETAVGFGLRDGVEHPVIAIQAGIVYPVAVRSDLKGVTKDLAAHQVFVRTLHANNKPSTARASFKDWRALFDTCFENREADIGRFLRRHLVGVEAATLLHALSEAAPSAPDVQPRLIALLNSGLERFHQLISERHIELPSQASWEVACIIEGAIPAHQPTQSFLDRLHSSNPQLTGWPLWVRGSGRKEIVTQVFDSKWEQLIPPSVAPDSDFWRIDPVGSFYHRRILEDDIEYGSEAPKPSTQLDFGLVVVRCTEAIAVAIEFAKAMGCDPEQCTLHFAFRWQGLAGRELSSWANRRRYLSGGRKAAQDGITVFLDLPLNVPHSAIGTALAAPLVPFYALFDGFELAQKVVEELANQTVSRAW